MPTDEKLTVCSGPIGLHAHTCANVSRSGWWKLWIAIPNTTELIRSLAVYAAAAGVTPAIAGGTNRPSVGAGLASQTRRSTLGRAAVVPLTDCFRFSQRPRRSLGPSGKGGCSRAGSAVHPLLAGPVPGCLFRLPHQCIEGGPPIIPISSAAYVRPLDRFGFAA